MEWTNKQSVKGPTLVLDPYEAEVLVLALNRPLKIYRQEFNELNATKSKNQELSPEEQQNYDILEEIINIVGDFVDLVELSEA